MAQIKPKLICYTDNGELFDCGDEWLCVMGNGKYKYYNKKENASMPFVFVEKADWELAISEKEYEELSEWYLKQRGDL